MSRLFSIGYGNRTWPALLALLKQHGCQFLIDVRSSPYSKFNPSFSQGSLTSLCSDEGIRYVFMGDTLGGKPKGSEHLNAGGKVDYIQLSESPEFQFGLARLLVAHSKGLSSFLMCSELRPEECHRCKLIGAVLAEKGIELTHIDEAGRAISQNEAMDRITLGQDDIFGPSPKASSSRGTYGDKK